VAAVRRVRRRVRWPAGCCVGDGQPVRGERRAAGEGERKELRGGRAAREGESCWRLQVGHCCEVLTLKLVLD
jgi:hypothetical protein